jgi:hypothetical protein
VLQGILLGTCMLFLPIYTGARLAAERSEVNVDLLFITTLRPRAIVTGKMAAALVLALMIFSACAPFLAFTYFLRGIDLPTIFFVLGLDFLAVIVAVQVGVFIAVVPTNRVLKALLAVFGLWWLGLLFAYTLVGTILLLDTGLPSLLEEPEFALTWGGIALLIGTFFGLFFTWSVALLHPPSANRAVAMRLFLLLCPATALPVAAWSTPRSGEAAFVNWLVMMVGLCCLALTIAVCEREHWGPRVLRSVPRRWWLRWPAFLFYSGAAGGVLFALLFAGVTALAAYLWLDAYLPRRLWMGFEGDAGQDPRQLTLRGAGLLVVYVYCYALTAAWLRRTFLPRLPTGYTWIVLLVLLLAGSALPFLVSFLIHYPDTSYARHVYWLLPNPGVAVMEVGTVFGRYETAFIVFAGVWAALITLASVPWFVRQVRGFRPFGGGVGARLEMPTLTVAPTPMDVTKTAP